MEAKRLVFEKDIQDSVHGFIGVTKTELSLIDSRIFQLLHHIKHLGGAWLVYPSANHSRFSHMLGTMFVTGQIAQSLSDKGWLTDDDVEKVRIAALLHDIGHYPFSHVIEHVMKKKGEKGKHEKLTDHLLRQSEIKDILQDSSYNPDEISGIILGRYTQNNLFSQLIASDLDSDKIDYLLRDSYHTGVAYGSVDVGRLIRTMDVDDEGRLHLGKRETGTGEPLDSEISYVPISLPP